MATVREKPASPSSLPTWTDAIPPAAMRSKIAYRPMTVGLASLTMNVRISCRRTADRRRSASWYHRGVRFRCVALVAASVFFAPGAAAQTRSAAQAQYDWGLAEMGAGHYASGCPAIAESYKLDPLPGALFTLAECENKWGRLATSLAHYAAYLDAFSRMTAKKQADQVGRDQLARVQRERLEREVPRLTVRLGTSAPQDTTIRCDGDPIGAPSLGMALPIDPGDHVITAETSDGRRFEEHFTMSTGEKQTHVVDLRAAPAPAPLPAPAAPGAAPSRPASPPAPLPVLELPPPSASEPSRAWIYAAGAVGLAGVAVGTGAGILTLGD